MDEEFYKSPLTQEQKWLNEYQNRSSQKNDSSSYSFSTDYSSELEEVYEQFAKYLKILIPNSHTKNSPNKKNSQFECESENPVEF